MFVPSSGSDTEALEGRTELLMEQLVPLTTSPVRVPRREQGHGVGSLA